MLDLKPDLICTDFAEHLDTGVLLCSSMMHFMDPRGINVQLQ